MRPPFVRSQFAADLSAATALRSDLDQWLYEALGLPAAIRYDVVLAAYEAMANAALHAYRDVAPPPPWVWRCATTQQPVSWL